MGLKFSVYHGSRTPNLGPVVFGFQVKMLCTTEELRQSVNQGSREWVEEMELRVFAARGLQGRLGGAKPSEHLGRVCVLQPEPCSCLPPGLQGQNARHQLWTCLPPTEESLCSLPALLCQGEPESPWPWVLCPREAVTVSHPRVPLKRAFTGVAVSWFPLRGQGPKTSRDLAPQGGPGLLGAWAEVVREVHILERTQAPDSRRNITPKWPLQWACPAGSHCRCHLCRISRCGGAGPSCLGQPFHIAPAPWLNLGALCGQQKPLLSRLVLWELSAQRARASRRQESVWFQYVQKGQSLAVSRSSDLVGR